MDERELEALLRDAVGEPPTASFTAGDVAARSARESARFRMRVATGGALAVLVLAGAGMVGVLGPGMDSLHRSGSDAAVASAPGRRSADSPEAGQPGVGAERPKTGDHVPDHDSSPMQGGEESAQAEPQVAEDASGCHQVDRELAIALAGELPDTASHAAAPVPGNGPCVEGGERAAFRVREGAASGLVSTAFVPSGTEYRIATVAGRRHAEARTVSGGTLIVISDPDPDAPAPVSDDLQRIADALAADR